MEAPGIGINVISDVKWSKIEWRYGIRNSVGLWLDENGMFQSLGERFIARIQSCLTNSHWELFEDVEVILGQ
jgi:hypothetical protein